MAIAKLKEVLGIDVRSLAVFRVSLALIILFDLFIRSKELVAHYTDLGVLPRADLIAHFSNSYWVSVHLISGQAFVQVLLFLVAAVFAFALLIGYKTRTATIVSWFLLISLHSRNPLVLQGGDIVLRVILFWAMFLPLGAYWSYDSLKNNKRVPKNVFSFGTLGILLQVAGLYVFAAFHKTGREWFPDGTALYYAFSADSFATPLAKFLLSFPDLLMYLTFSVLFFELLGPFLLFIPLFFGQVRTTMTFAFFALILGMGLTLHISHFTWISLASFLVFLPCWFWEKFPEFFYKKRSEKLKVYYDGNCGSCRLLIDLIRVFLILPKKAFAPAQDKKEILHLMNKNNSWVVDSNGKKYFHFDAFKPIFSASPLFWVLSPVVSFSLIRKLGNKLYKIFARRRKIVCEVPMEKPSRRKRDKILFISGNILAAFFIVYMLLWNIQTLGPNAVPDNTEFVFGLTRVDQLWNMFAPYPIKSDGWLVVEGKLADGRKIDLVRDGKAIAWEKPDKIPRIYGHERWRKYLMNLWQKRSAVHRQLYARYLCKNWNENHEGQEKLEELSIFYMREQTLPDYQKPEIEKIFLHKQFCFPPKR